MVAVQIPAGRVCRVIVVTVVPRELLAPVLRPVPQRLQRRRPCIKTLLQIGGDGRHAPLVSSLTLTGEREGERVPPRRREIHVARRGDPLRRSPRLLHACPPWIQRGLASSCQLLASLTDSPLHIELPRLPRKESLRRHVQNAVVEEGVLVLLRAVSGPRPEGLEATPRITRTDSERGELPLGLVHAHTGLPLLP